MKHIYGPVKSRRLGLSLGLSLTCHKTCNFDCLYCQLGRTQDKAFERKEYIKVEEVIRELKSWVRDNHNEAERLNYITISGCGEPTLNIKIGEVIDEIRKVSTAKIALITNASFLHEPEARRPFLKVDLIVPSLDSADPDVFARIDRPQQGIRLDDIIGGLVSLRKEFCGKIWLEVMIIRGINDDLAGIRKLKEAVDKINPDKIQVNSPVRTTAEENIFPADIMRLEEIKDILGQKCEII